MNFSRATTAMALNNNNSDHENEGISEFGEKSLVRTKDKILKHLAMFTETQLRNLNEGKVLYNSGAKRGFRWRSICFKNQNFRAYYAMKIFPARFNIMRKALDHAVDESMLTATFLKSIKKVLSFGCGPGVELYAAKSFMAEIFPHRIQNYTRITGPHFIGYDIELGWLLYLDQLGLDFHCQDINESFIASLPDAGVHAPLQSGGHNEDAPRFRRRLPVNIPSVDSIPADIIIMSHFAVASSFFKENKNWDVILKKAKFIMVVDVKDVEMHELLTKRGFSHFHYKDILETEVHVYCYKV